LLYYVNKADRREQFLNMATPPAMPKRLKVSAIHSKEAVSLPYRGYS
jgi:hypothetical protein